MIDIIDEKKSMVLNWMEQAIWMLVFYNGLGCFGH